MRLTELEFLLAVAANDTLPRQQQETVRQIANRVGVFKRNCYYLDKWARKDWYEYGVALDLGWLTDKGRVAIRKLLQEL